MGINNLKVKREAEVQFITEALLQVSGSLRGRPELPLLALELLKYGMRTRLEVLGQGLARRRGP
jgi:hypothetical protein